MMRFSVTWRVFADYQENEELHTEIVPVENLTQLVKFINAQLLLEWYSLYKVEEVVA
tara:strand:- start:42328 stop:42498 length:171 start_codon:yes stop_codon:yes gene_type:complete